MMVMMMIIIIIIITKLLAIRIRTFRADPAHKLSAKLYDIYH